MEQMRFNHIVVDVEANGPVPGLYSMTAFGAVIVEPEFLHRFVRYLKPLPGADSKSDYEMIARFPGKELSEPDEAMQDFYQWLGGLPPKIFWADNNGFDWQFINWYFHKFCGLNPFGHSSCNINSLFKGQTGDFRSSFKHLRRTKHTHDPLDDAIGNAEALLEIFKSLKGV